TEASASKRPRVWSPTCSKSNRRRSSSSSRASRRSTPPIRSSRSSARTCRRTGRSELDPCRQPHLGTTQLEPAGPPAPVRVPLPRHRLHVTVPFEVEGLETEPDGATATLPSFVIGRVPADGFDLAVAVTGVLLGMQLVRRGRAP